ncbi:MAG TPA: hypothetical protein VGD62_11015 [Acidobacteriaceae bacterium]
MRLQSLSAAHDQRFPAVFSTNVTTAVEVRRLPCPCCPHNTSALIASASEASRLRHRLV